VTIFLLGIIGDPNITSRNIFKEDKNSGFLLGVTNFVTNLRFYI